MREKILAIIEKNSRIDLKDLAALLGESEAAVANEIASSGSIKCTSQVAQTGLLNCSPRDTIFRLMSIRSSTVLTVLFSSLSINMSFPRGWISR